MKRAMLPNLSMILSLIAAAIGVAVLIGWKFDIATLKSVFPDQTTMKANTAFIIMLFGLAIALLVKSSRVYNKIFISIAAVLILTFASVTMMQYIFQVNLGVDELLVSDKSDEIKVIRMSPTTAFCLINLALATILSTKLIPLSSRRIFIGTFCTTVIVIAGCIFLSYIPNMLFGYEILHSTNMGIHTSLALMLLATSLMLFLYQDDEFVWILSPRVTIGAILFLVFILLSVEEYQRLKLDLYQALIMSPLSILVVILLLALGIFTLNESISERNKIDAIRNRLAAIVDSSTDGIVSKSLNGIVTSWNLGATQIFGYTESEMVGQHISKLFPEDRMNEEPEILKHILKGEKVEHFETIRKRKDGKFINVSVSISPLKDSNNVIIGASKIVRDITEDKRLEVQFRQSQKMGAIGQLSGGIAHDFNNILGIIIGNLDLLSRSVADNENAMKRTQTALKAATRGADLTKRLLAFSRQQPLSPKPSNLNDSVKNLVEMASHILGANIQITTELDDSLPPALVDIAELESALLNLSVNARDAMPNGGRLIVSTKLRILDDRYPSVQVNDIPSGTYAAISVTDTGEGIPPEVLEHVYEPFFTTKERGKGTGMGLSMVYGFAKQSGGTVKIYSEVGQGTTVTMYLPIADNVTLPEAEINKTANMFVDSHVKALVVDDEPDLLEIASLYLKDMGIEILNADNAANAIKVFESTPGINLLVTDVVMPGEMNGIDLAKHLRKLKPEINVVYLSGFPLAKFDDDKDSSKIDSHFLSKPYQRDEFTNLIASILTNKPN